MKTFLKYYAAIVVVTVMSCTLIAQQAAPAEKPADPPSLTETQKKDLQIAILVFESAQKDLQLAQRKVQDASESANKLLATLQHPGYTLDLQTMTYTKTAAAPKEGAAPK